MPRKGRRAANLTQYDRQPADETQMASYGSMPESTKHPAVSVALDKTARSPRRRLLGGGAHAASEVAAQSPRAQYLEIATDGQRPDEDAQAFMRRMHSSIAGGRTERLVEDARTNRAAAQTGCARLMRMNAGCDQFHSAPDGFVGGRAIRNFEDYLDERLPQLREELEDDRRRAAGESEPGAEAAGAEGPVTDEEELHVLLDYAAMEGHLSAQVIDSVLNYHHVDCRGDEGPEYLKVFRRQELTDLVEANNLLGDEDTHLMETLNMLMDSFYFTVAWTLYRKTKHTSDSVPGVLDIASVKAGRSGSAIVNFLAGTMFAFLQCAVMFGAGPPRHGLSSDTMVLITSDYGIMCSLRTKWP